MKFNTRPLLIAAAAVAVLASTNLSVSAAPVNKHVVPGAVQWKAQMDEACAASAKSGKPVLLFVMLGNLDQEFC